jgi:hypothetical protein
MWTMSFNMECGDPFRQGQSDIDLHSFIPTNCDVYVVGLQEAGGEIKNVPPSPSAPGPAEPQDGLYNMIEMYLLGEASYQIDSPLARAPSVHATLFLLCRLPLAASLSSSVAVHGHLL